MLISRGLALRRVIQAANSVKNVRNMSGHTYVYRVGAPPSSKKILYLAEITGAIMWWWVLWHCWHEPDHITGEFDYPDASKWTNAELGIPDD